MCLTMTQMTSDTSLRTASLIQKGLFLISKSVEADKDQAWLVFQEPWMLENRDNQLCPLPCSLTPSPRIADAAMSELQRQWRGGHKFYFLSVTYFKHIR